MVNVMELDKDVKEAIASYLLGSSISDDDKYLDCDVNRYLIHMCIHDLGVDPYDLIRRALERAYAKGEDVPEINEETGKIDEELFYKSMEECGLLKLIEEESV